MAAIVSRQRLTGASNGSSAYLLAIARTLRDEGFAVHLVQPSPAIAGRTPFYRLAPEMDVFTHHAVRSARRVGSQLVFGEPKIYVAAALGILRRLLRRIGVGGSWVGDRKAPYAVATPWSEADHRFLRAHLPEDTTLVVADYVFCTPAFANAPVGAWTATIMHDLFHQRAGGAADSVAELDRASEVQLLGEADAVLAIQEAERRFLTEQVPGTRGVLVPMPAEPVDSAQPGRNDSVLFVGSDTAPNVEGLRWFLAKIWPLVSRARPKAELRVAGTVFRAFDMPVRGVTFLGLVPDLAPLYREAGIVVSPLTFGSGLKIKLIEAMSHGKAMVVTGITLQGVEESCGLGVIRADTPDVFAEQVIALAAGNEAREALGEKALACIRKQFTIERAHSELRAWLLTVDPARPSNLS